MGITASGALPPLIDWPRDEAAHDGLSWEIWWFTAVVEAGGRRYATHALLNHLDGGALYVTASLTDLDGGAERTERLYVPPGGTAPARDRLSVTTPLCSLTGAYADGYDLRATLAQDCGFALSFRPTRPPLLNGGAGSYMFLGVPTTQYSIGFLDTSGTVRVDGQDIAVTGRGWHDRQWERDRRGNELVFTWFGLCLDGGDTLSVFDIGDEDGRWATIARPDSTHIVTAISAEPIDTGTTPAGRAVPQRWLLSIPAMAARLELRQRPVSDDARIYTGAIDISGTYDGAPAGGYGFCDVVGPIPPAV